VSGSRRRVGRPPRINRAAIARVAGEMPLGDITLRSVADRLDVSVPSLYHYVSGRADLLRLAAEQTAIRMTLPEDTGQHWAVWFYQWADYVRRAFVADPELLGQFIDGAFGVDRMAGHIDVAIGVCARHGLSDRAGFEAYALVSEYALGAAISQIRAAHAARDGQSPALDLRLFAFHEAGDLPHLHRLAAADPLALPPFGTRIAAVLAGVAARHGAPQQDIAALVEAAASEAAASEAAADEAAATEAAAEVASEAGPVT
jgi:AcrR family transcriptional regulator